MGLVVAGEGVDNDVVGHRFVGLTVVGMGIASGATVGFPEVGGTIGLTVGTEDGNQSSLLGFALGELVGKALEEPARSIVGAVVDAS